MLRKLDGKMVHELRPEVDWNKGRAVEWLLENLKEEYGEEDIFPIYIGDDVTDEDAFRTLRHAGAIRNGLGIIVAEHPVLESATDATYQLRNPQEVQAFLQWFTQPAQAALAWHKKKHYAGTGPPAAIREESSVADSASAADADSEGGTPRSRTPLDPGSDLGSVSGADTPQRPG